MPLYSQLKSLRMLLLTLFLLPSLCLSAGAGLITDKSVFSNEPEFLDVDKAFILDVYQNKDKIHVSWKVEDTYYLYRKRFSFSLEP
ncbi:MAG: hypothetical protein JKY01_09890, partial [Pseudomonadales bacterium]|nr:hypothetical protein [Pseudomonadales bacterium]